MTVPRWFALVARPLSWVYGGCVACWRSWFLHVRRPTRLSIPVVSVGNLTVGGTGKGPFVRWLVEQLRADSATPVIALRGYRAGAVGSDEAMEYARLLPGVNVAVGADRAAAIRAQCALNNAIDVAVLDDGFQHWRLARDLDLVLIDATRPSLDDPMLPSGPRREAVSALRRADAVIVTHAKRVDSTLSTRVEAAHGRAPIAWCRHAWTALEVHGGDEGQTNSAPAPLRVPPTWLKAKRVGVVAAIGHPEAFFAQVEAMASGARWLLRARDHDGFEVDQLSRICERARAEQLDFVVTTMKDWVKLEPLVHATPTARGIFFVVPIVEIEFLAGEAALRSLLRSRVPRQRETHG